MDPVLRFHPIRTIWIVALLYAVFSIVLSRIPLFNYLGYEFSAATGIVGGLLSGILTINLFRQNFVGKTSLQKSDLISFLRFVVFINLVLLLIPLILISLNAFFVKNCSFSTGLAFFLLIPVITVFFGASLGLCSAVWFRRPVLMYTIFFVLILLRPVYLTLTSPQLFAYNVLFGYFPGFTYDEVLRITKTLLLFRALTVVSAFTILMITLIATEHTSLSDHFWVRMQALRYLFRRHSDSVAAILGLLIVLSAYLFRNAIGFESSASFIQRELGSRITTLHFNIYYSSDKVSDDRIKWIAAEHEFRYLQVSRMLQVNLLDKIDSYIYPTPELKRRLIGTSTTDIAKPWRKEIHLNLDSFEETLRHELVHVLAGAFGMPILRISPSPGLIEGLAVACDWDAGDRTPHQFSAALFKFGLVSDVHGIFSFAGFASKPSSVSYLLSGSFCRYLIDEYGLRKFMAAYPWAQFQKTYKKPLGELLEEWKEYLRSVRVPPTDLTRAKLLFARPSIISKVCARTVADLNEAAAKLFSKKEYGEAARMYRSTYAMTRGREAALGLFAAEFRNEEYDSVVVQLQNVLGDSTQAPAFVLSRLLLGDCYWILGRPQTAKQTYEELRKLDVHEAYNVAAAIRIEALRHREFETSMKNFLAAAGEDSTRYSILEQALADSSASPIVHLQLGRMDFQEGRYEAAISNLSGIAPRSSIRAKKPFVDPVLDFELEKTLGLSLFHTKDFQNAKIHLWQSLNYTGNEGGKNFIDDQIEYCNWLDAHRSLLN
jgi:tetratricopeptide (TPR) repeat protein